LANKIENINIKIIKKINILIIPELIILLINTVWLYPSLVNVMFFNIIEWFNEFYLWINTNNEKMSKFKTKKITTTTNNTFQFANHEVNVFYSFIWFFTTTPNTNKKLKKKLFTQTFLNIDESRNLTILKYISRSSLNIPFSTSKSLKIMIVYIRIIGRERTRKNKKYSKLMKINKKNKYINFKTYN
jgi:hypothetical protein